jgi:hypothetical protein
MSSILAGSSLEQENTEGPRRLFATRGAVRTKPLSRKRR